jgi:hypothetical protein
MGDDDDYKRYSTYDISRQDGQRTYNVTLLRVRLMLIPPRVS